MKYAINLIGEKEIPVIDRVFYFLLNYLRYIIVVTQLIVIGVFFYRFKIDQSIVDLKESVDQKKEIIQVVIPLLNQVSDIDKRMKISNQILIVQKQFSSIINYIISTFPQSIFLSKLDISADSIRFTGIATNAKDLQSYYTYLRKDAKFSKINLQNLKKIDDGYSFDMILENYKNN